MSAGATTEVMCKSYERYITRTDSLGLCRGCDVPLKRNRDGSIAKGRVWCSARCDRWFRKNHQWTYARVAARVRDHHRCARLGCTSRDRLEVNHIDPRVGRGYRFGCGNHLANLETLCHTCHVFETNRQRADRRSMSVSA